MCILYLGYKYWRPKFDEPCDIAGNKPRLDYSNKTVPAEILKLDLIASYKLTIYQVNTSELLILKHPIVRK